MDLKKKRWLILIASCFVTLCAGSLYAWSAISAIIAPNIHEGWTGKDLAIVFTVANSVGPITMILGGKINDKLGPKLVLLTGGLLFGAGMVGTSFAGSLGMLIVCYGLGVGLGVGMIYGTIVSTAVKFFPDKSGLAGGMTTACYGGSSVIMPLLVNAMYDNGSGLAIETVILIIGIVMTVIICGSAFVIQACPADFTVSGGRKNAKAAAAPANDMDWKQMLKQPSFYLMLTMLTCGAFAGMMVLSQAKTVAEQMMLFDGSTAALVVSVLALFNMAGRLVAGSASDKLGAPKTLAISFVLSIVAGSVLFFCDETMAGLFWGGLAVIGFCFGCIMGIYPGFTAKQFGRKNNSVNYGIMFIGFALAGFLGPIIMTSIVEATGRYQPAFLVSAALAAAGVVLTVIFMLKNRKKH